MKSLVNYPNRGKWGNNKWRGNCSGYMIRDLINHFNPKTFVDVCEGSGTSREVCKELGVKYQGLDLHSGFNFLEDSVLENIKNPADIVFSHPPYHDMIKYSGNQWGNEIDINDLSHCNNVDEFLEKSHLMLLNQREATSPNGVYCSLIADMRRKDLGFKSFQSDYIQMMPKDELLSVVIKTQNNYQSSFKNYQGRFIPIMHEYLIIWKKSSRSLFLIQKEKAFELKRSIASSWRNAIRMAFIKNGKSMNLSQIYNEVEHVSQNLIKNNSHWKAKVRQILQKHYANVERGVWAVA